MKAVRLLEYGHLHPATDIACVLQVRYQHAVHGLTE